MIPCDIIIKDYFDTRGEPSVRIEIFATVMVSDADLLTITPKLIKRRLLLDIGHNLKVYGKNIFIRYQDKFQLFNSLK